MRKGVCKGTSELRSDGKPTRGKVRGGPVPSAPSAVPVAVSRPYHYATRSLCPLPDHPPSPIRGRVRRVSSEPQARRGDTGDPTHGADGVPAKVPRACPRPRRRRKDTGASPLRRETTPCLVPPSLPPVFTPPDFSGRDKSCTCTVVPRPQSPPHTPPVPPSEALYASAPARRERLGGSGSQCGSEVTTETGKCREGVGATLEEHTDSHELAMTSSFPEASRSFLFAFPPSLPPSLPLPPPAHEHPPGVLPPLPPSLPVSYALQQRRGILRDSPSLFAALRRDFGELCTGLGGKFQE